jgi:hypothetical protein
MNIKSQENIISILKIKVQRSSIFISSQSKYIKFNLDQSESSTQIWDQAMPVIFKQTLLHHIIQSVHRLIKDTSPNILASFFIEIFNTA